VKGIVGLLLGIALGAFIACGSSQKPIDRISLHNDISTLWTQIRDWRHDAHMVLDPSPQMMNQLINRTVKDAETVCVENHKVPKTCEDICGLSDAICSNAEAICRIADDLGKDDDYAQEKCTSAKASCREAKQKCGTCSTASSDLTTKPEPASPAAKP
jgi:hypothetical protein